MKVQQVLNENMELKQENQNSKERLDKLESLQQFKQCNHNRNTRTAVGKLYPNETESV